MTPVIGISCYVERARWGPWDRSAALIPYTYVNVVAAAGACPILLPPGGGQASTVIDRLDGLVLAGGADVGPDLYAAQPHAETVTRPDRDANEMALLRAALAVDLPVLGVCRGMQLLAVAYGGALDQHLPESVGHPGHLPEPGVFGAHPATFAPGSRVAAIFGPVSEVNSYHHQSIADPGRLAVTGWAGDGVIEAVEDPAMRFVLGVQWHPEEAADVRPFAALVAAAGAPAGAAARARRAVAG
ncbi:MAG TPA: gamma-glutamyl-gamma-aminobutyrate hydrolase family protein [Micromonosporaceae bacterium]|jgi:putative glutamine amidotransferase|nr:gamma-glutamyl-gamma-aminobutyrate hydrolase family protein [Micromonosporaceae bacterium]